MASPALPAARAVRQTRRKELGSGGVGGRSTYCRRPIQKTSVAMNIKAPGMPKATAGPYCLRKMGINSDAKNEPKLMIQ